MLKNLSNSPLARQSRPLGLEANTAGTSYFKNDEVIKMTSKNRSRLPLLLIGLFIVIAVPVAAQSPNTATMIVVVVDQNDAVVKDAKVSVLNNATGARREAVSGNDGSATIPALSLTGTYMVVVSREGFGDQELNNIALRSGETATLNVKLIVGSQTMEVTVFGTTEGVRADPQIGHRLDGRQIDETPILGRKVTTLPLQSL
jgi:Carboxypeptidase regulatory-like domain